MVVVRDLGVTEEVVLKEFYFNKGAYLQMYWLRDRYDELVETQMYEVTARVYILHLVACTLFTYKSHVYIEAQYMWLLSSLDNISLIWGCAGLIILYTTLGVAIAFETRQLVGYLSLFQVYLKFLFVV